MSAEKRRAIEVKASAAHWRGKDDAPESDSSQSDLDVRPDQSICAPFERIFEEAATTNEKDRWFERLFMAVARDVPDFQVADIWPRREWPDHARLTGLDGWDTGIDLVAKLDSDAFAAVQYKYYDRGHRVSKPDTDSFISASDIGLDNSGVFDFRWVVSTCPWNSNAESAIRNKNPEVHRINFLDRTICELDSPAVRREPKLPWPNMDECRGRAVLDVAAARVAGLDKDQVADWRARLVVEPSIKRAWLRRKR